MKYDVLNQPEKEKTWEMLDVLHGHFYQIKPKLQCFSFIKSGH